MGIKIKHRDPKSTDFSSKDIIVNVKEGTLFYKSDTSLFKIQGDDLNTLNTEITDDYLNLSGSIIVTGSITPEKDIHNLGSSTDKWKEINVKSGSFDGVSCISGSVTATSGSFTHFIADGGSF
tara:strand:- start:376 stop:744 length:369 start_codon:yes stop_codon:yes gene_type:complete